MKYYLFAATLDLIGFIINAFTGRDIWAVGFMTCCIICLCTAGIVARIKSSK